MRGELDPAGRAVEQTKPHTPFELLDQHAQARWRDEEHLGRAREIVMLRREAEGAQLPGTDFH